MPGPDEKHHLLKCHLLNGVRKASRNWKIQGLQQFDKLQTSFTASSGTEKMIKKKGERKRVLKVKVKWE